MPPTLYTPMDPISLPITQPDAGQVVAGSVIGQQPGPLGENCLILAHDEGCRAYAIDPCVRLKASDKVELRTVVLVKQDAPAWEVYVRQAGLGPQLVPGQHCAQRTALAEQWLKELQTGLLADLLAQAERLRSERQGQEATRQAINPAGQPELLYASALATARQELLGREYVQVCRTICAAEHRSAKLAAALQRHHYVREGLTSRPGPWGWIPRWRTRYRLHRLLNKARAWHQRTEAHRRRLERSANSAGMHGRIERRAQELLQTDRACARQTAVLEREERVVAQQVAEAQRLVHFLQEREGLPVTLTQTSLKERTPTLPTIPDGATRCVNWCMTTTMAAPSTATEDGPVLAPGSPTARPKPERETAPAARPWLEAPPPITPAKSNGIGMKM